jgi:hypothetical protein
MRIRSYLDPGVDESVIYQNVWAATTVVHRGNVKALILYNEKDRLKVNGRG